MDVRVGFVIILQVLLIFNNVSGSITPPLNSRQIVAAGISVINRIKKDFEIDLSRERTSRNQLFSAYNAFYDEFFKTLQNVVFLIEDSKANSILTVLRATPDVNCANRLKRQISDIKSKEVRNVYKICATEIDAEIQKIKIYLTRGQNLIYTAFTEAQEAIRACERVHTLTKNLNELESCVNQAGSVQRDALRFENVFEKRTSKIILITLGKCTDLTIIAVQNALNANYDELEMCLKSSSNDASRHLASVISTKYKLTLTSKEEENVATAIVNLHADAPAVLGKLDALSVRVKAILTDSNRDRVILKELISRNEEVINYQNAFSRALENQGGYAGKSCVRSGQTRMQTMISTKTEDWKRCLNSIKGTQFVAEINKIEKSIITRESKEGFVAIIKCLASTVLSIENTVACSQKADTNFIKFLDENSIKLNEENLSVDMIQALVNKCESSVFSTIPSSLVANEVTFDKCLTKASINYKLF